jgi:hypothetical protein
MLCWASIQEMKWKPKSPPPEGPRKKSGDTATTAARRMMAGPAKPRGRGKRLIVLFDSLSRRGLFKIESPAMCDASVAWSCAERAGAFVNQT